MIELNHRRSGDDSGCVEEGSRVSLSRCIMSRRPTMDALWCDWPNAERPAWHRVQAGRENVPSPDGAYPREYDLHARNLRSSRVDRHAADTPSRGRRRPFSRRDRWAPSRTRRVRGKRCDDRNRGGEWRGRSWSCSTVRCGFQCRTTRKRRIAPPMIHSKRCASGRVAARRNRRGAGYS